MSIPASLLTLAEIDAIVRTSNTDKYVSIGAMYDIVRLAETARAGLAARALREAAKNAWTELEYTIQMLEAHAPYELIGGEQEALDALAAALRDTEAQS